MQEIAPAGFSSPAPINVILKLFGTKVLRRVDGKILDRVTRQRHDDADGGRHDPAREMVHSSEEETDCAKKVICARRVGSVVERELVIDFQDDLWCRE